MLVVLAAVYAGPRLLASDSNLDLPPVMLSPVPAAGRAVPASSAAGAAMGQEEEAGEGVGFSGSGVDEDGKDRLMAMVHDAATKRMTSGQLRE